MKARQFVIVFVGMCLVSGAAFAADENVSPEQQTQMGQMKARMTPGAPHKALEVFVGKWSYAGKFWMTPEAKPDEMTGTQQNTMIYGGRFLKQESTGPWMGETFEGLGYTGYDNIKGEYMTVWLDSMGTGIFTMAGQYEDVSKTLKQSGANSCPLTGEKARQGRSEWAIIDNDHNTYTSYTVGPDGKEFKSMELAYARA